MHQLTTVTSNVFCRETTAVAQYTATHQPLASLLLLRYTRYFFAKYLNMFSNEWYRAHTAASLPAFNCLYDRQFTNTRCNYNFRILLMLHIFDTTYNMPSTYVETSVYGEGRGVSLIRLQLYLWCAVSWFANLCCKLWGSSQLAPLLSSHCTKRPLKFRWNWKCSPSYLKIAAGRGV